MATWGPIGSIRGPKGDHGDAGPAGPQGDPSVQIVTALPPSPDPATLYVVEGEGIPAPFGIPDVGGLQAALDAKAPTVHTHTAGQITGGTAGHVLTSTGSGAAQWAAPTGGGGAAVTHQWWVETSQAIPNNTDRGVRFDGIVAGNGTHVTRTVGTVTTGSTFIIQKAGLWVCEIGMQFAQIGSASGGSRARFVVNGAPIFSESAQFPDPRMSGSRTTRLAVGDQITVTAQHNTGGDKSLNIHPSSCWVALTLLG